MRYVLQGNGYGLGNFVMLTPALQLLYKRNKQKLNVYFEDTEVASLFKNCKFINILERRPKGKPFMSCAKPTRKGRESDSEAFCRIYAKTKDHIPDTYVDDVRTIELSKENDKKYVALFHGCTSKKLIDKKDVGPKIRQEMIRIIVARGMVPVVLGTKMDDRLYWSQNVLSNCVSYLDKLKLIDSVSILNQCDFFMSNDTGLYHVAGAVSKAGIVIWKKTDPIKNKSTFREITHLRSDADRKTLSNTIGEILDRKLCQIL